MEQKASREKTNVVLDHNWVTPMTLAAEKGVHCSTVTNWIRRNKIDYVVIRGETMRRHLVDRRTAPAVRPVGRPKKHRLRQQPKHS